MISIKNDFCLKPFNTFRISVRASCFVPVSRVKHLDLLFRQNLLSSENILIISEGSNVLFTKDFDGLVLHNELWGIKIINEGDDFVVLEANAGESWSKLVDYTVDKGWGGLENLALIPGKVGAAPIQNIGAYGVEVKDVIENVTAFDMQMGELVTFSKEQCQFAYRSSFFKTEGRGRYFITSVQLKLLKNPVLNLTYWPLSLAFMEKENVSLKDVCAEVKRIRQSKLPDPEQLPNSGSFFKNPVLNYDQAEKLLAVFPEAPNYPQENGQIKLAAGWLIEKCGWKGKRIGDVGVHEKQALVLVNYGNASGQQVLEFAQNIIKSVHEKMGVMLEPEVNIY
jgi:UDP-N-acetylmuramate dehydrogenase